MVNYKYNAWGNHKVLSPNGVEIIDETHIGIFNPHRYRGYYYCAELGLYYLKSRFYDPYIGRFISADSLDYLDPHTVGGVNLFAYCNNNPVMNVDPTGHAFWNKIKTAVKRTAAKVKTAVKQVVNRAKTTVKSVVNSVGAVLVTGKEIAIKVVSVIPGIVTVESGTGYNKNFGNGKAINFYLEGSKFSNYSVGVDANIGGYGVNLGVGLLSVSAGIHLGTANIEWTMSAPVKFSLKCSYIVDGKYVYDKTTIDFLIPILAVALRSCGIVDFRVPARAGG